jgi:hypothetical protein
VSTARCPAGGPDPAGIKGTAGPSAVLVICGGAGVGYGLAEDLHFVPSSPVPRFARPALVKRAGALVD